MITAFTFSIGIGCAQSVPASDSISLTNKVSHAYKIFLAQPDSAIALSKRVVQKASELNYTELEAYCYYVMGKAYWAKADYSTSADYSFKALKIFENSTQHKLWGKTLLSIARIFIDLKNLDQGKIYIQRAQDLAVEKKDEFLLAEAYREKSMLYSESQDYDSALYYSDKGIALFEKFNDSLDASILYGRKAKIYFLLKDYKQSKYYNKRSMLYDSLVGNRRALGITYYQSALDAVHLGKQDSAIYLLNKSIALGKEIRNITSLIKANSLLSEIYLDKKQPLKAIECLKAVSSYKDSLYSTEKSGQIQEMESLYQLSSKEKTIQRLSESNSIQQQLLNNQRTFVAFLLGGVLLLGITVYVLMRYKNLQEKTNHELAIKNQAIEQQREEMATQAENLQQLNDLKTKLFSVISHDLRGPMATLHSLLDLLTKKHVTPEEFIMISDKVGHSLKVTERTLENLLNWSLSQMDGLHAELKTFDVGISISEACDLMQEPAQRKRINLEKMVNEEVFVKADADQVHLILRNLIHNAIKFSKPADTIMVTTERNGKVCTISVKDNGIGMTNDELHTLLDARNYFSKTGTNKEKGTGLGLLLCKEFIKLNGGQLDIKSRVNQGTEVIFTLPLA